MNNDRHLNDSRRGARGLHTLHRTFALGLVAVFSFSMVGCDDFFDVDNPTNLVAEDLDDPDLAEALGNSAETAVAGAFDDAAIWNACMSDECFLSGSGTFRIQIEEGITEGYNQLYDNLYNALAAARWIADNTTERSKDLSGNPNSDIRVARGLFWGGFARMLLADHFRDVVYDGGPPITPVQAIQDAIVKFTESASIAQAAGDPDFAAAATGQIARAYRSLYWEDFHHGAGGGSNFQQAATAAREALALSDDFREDVNYQQPGSSNGLWGSFNSSVYTRMDPAWAYLEDPASGATDPRIPHSEQEGFSLRENWPVYLQHKYPDRSADIPASRADEARLIIAEYEAMFGDLQAAVSMINEVRSDVGLADFSSTDQAEIITQLKYERRVEFWLENRRWQDMRYYDEISDRWNDASKAAGVHRRWPVSQRERSTNPAYTGG